ncbi:MAG: hypothetical protein AAF127_02285 [Pseudomonadota bacterium]
MAQLIVRILGMAMLICGVLWALQGLGIVMWPAGSVMLAQREWALYGSIIAAFGLLVLALSGRFGPRG